MPVAELPPKPSLLGCKPIFLDLVKFQQEKMFSLSYIFLIQGILTCAIPEPQQEAASVTAGSGFGLGKI
jgi:hypothetical protein